MNALLDDLRTSYDVFCLQLDSILLEYEEDMVTESTSNNIFKSVHKFFVNLIQAFQRFISDAKIHAAKICRDIYGRHTLKTIEQQLQEAKKEGKKTCEITDLESIRKLYESMYRELKSIAGRFSGPYSDPIKVNQDLEAFNDVVERYEKELLKVQNKKIRMSIDDGLRYVGKELSGQTRTFDLMNQVIADLEKMEKDAELLGKKQKALGGDMLEAQRNVFVRAASKLASAVKNFFTKLVVAVCLIV